MLGNSTDNWPLVPCARVYPGNPGTCHALLIPFLLALLLAPPVLAQSYRGPIIDVHLHAGPAAPGAPNPATGKPTTANTDTDRQRLTLEAMRELNIVLGLASGPDPHMAGLRQAGGDAIWALPR